jgi:probable HAF family extracellular repeat protein
MREKKRLVLYGLQISLLMPLAVAQIYTVTDLGTLGGFYSAATGVNARGQVVGYSDIADHSAVHAFVWNRHSGMQDLNLAGITQSLATGINDLGHVVGVATFPVGPDHFQAHAVMWTKQNGIWDFGTLGNFSTAFGVNDRDQVVGDTNITGGNTDAAFLWTKAGGLEDLGTLGGGGATAQAINNLGHVVGGSFTGDGFHAFSWTRSIGMRDLGTLGGCESQATGINGAGQIVGGSSIDCVSNNRHAFLWTSERGLQDLGAPEGTFFGGPGAVNILGMVVGAACPLQCFSQESVHGFIWTTATGWLDLNNLIPADSGWVIENVTAINVRGQITGQGFINGQYHAFLLSPNFRATQK